MAGVSSEWLRYLTEDMNAAVVGLRNLDPLPRIPMGDIIDHLVGGEGLLDTAKTEVARSEAQSKGHDADGDSNMDVDTEDGEDGEYSDSGSEADEHFVEGPLLEYLTDLHNDMVSGNQPWVTF
ncbi:hypothetical protein BKA56DRAFT_666640 [Ilyonectria sp. MPI-CAGE-AT-0026]|nr:hypothetical protein BKA56DRAFT_666640 [Ilyonectria sp. MPI-CAGE-AT-0026]